MGLPLGWGTAVAQTPPDAGRILQETRPQPVPGDAAPLPLIVPPASAHLPAASSSGDARVQVSQFTFTGNGALSSEVLAQALTPWVGRALNFGQLIEVVEAVEARYKQAGFFLAQANLPPQSIRDGVVEIGISEGRLGETRIEGESHIAASVVFAYLDRLPAHQALLLADVERQVLLINELAGSKVVLDLQAGEQPGSTDVVLTQQMDDYLSGRLEANNYGVPSTGENRLGLTLTGNSLLQQGERISLNTQTSDTSGLATYTLRGELPLGGQGWRVTASASRASYSLGGNFSSLGASGTADAVRAGVAYPWLVSRSKNLRFQLEGDQSQLKDNFSASNVHLDKQSAGLTWSTSADWLDEWAGGGANRLDLVLRTAQLDLGDTASTQDTAANGYHTQGNFNKLLVNASRQQTLARDHSLLLALTWQLADKNLDSSEKLSLGGPQTLPGFGSGDAIADSGYQLKLQWRWQAAQTFAVSLFGDYASLQLHQNALPSDTVNSRTLGDYGLGADWSLGKRWSASALFAWPGSAASIPADNDKTRFWLTLACAW
jgi:hemolysin activation/secretion protein